MYATCLHCTRPLGRNEAIESFPVGRRLAFDAATGRLWVVCPHCARWNLSPLEERWEAIEACERRFRDSRLRVSTDNIGLARLREGVELVRVGKPQRPELAAWRYGRQFGRRRRRHLVTTGAIAAAGGVVLFGVVATGIVSIASMLLFRGGEQLFELAQHGPRRTLVARLRADDGRLLRVQRVHLGGTTLATDDDGQLALHVEHTDGRTLVTGDAARRAAAMLLPAVNRAGGTSDEVAAALGRLERAGDAERFLRDTARRGTRLTSTTGVAATAWAQAPDGQPLSSGLLALPTSLALAAEMALHEAQERRALEGELAALEQAWREAEEIAAIADGLLLPTRVHQVLDRLRGGARAME